MKNVVALCLWLLVGCSHSVVPDHLYYIHDATFDDIISYTVGVRNSPRSGNTCSGVIVKNDGENIWVLTAAHCVDDNETGKIRSLLYIQYMTTRKLQMVKVIKEDSFVDLALLRSFNRPLYNYAPAIISDSLPALGEHVWTINNHFSLAEGQISKLHEQCPRNLGKCFEMFSSTDFGYSGGGVFDEDHKLIGIIVTFDDDNGETDSIHQIEIFKFLRGEI